jgi:hypothetical protein
MNNKQELMKWVKTNADKFDSVVKENVLKELTNTFEEEYNSEWYDQFYLRQCLITCVLHMRNKGFEGAVQELKQHLEDHKLPYHPQFVI